MKLSEWKRIGAAVWHSLVPNIQELGCKRLPTHGEHGVGLKSREVASVLSPVTASGRQPFNQRPDGSALELTDALTRGGPKVIRGKQDSENTPTTSARRSQRGRQLRTHTDGPLVAREPRRFSDRIVI